MAANDLNLGQLITTKQNRDAIHVAVAPVVANGRLRPGQHIGFIDKDAGVVSANAPKRFGIVDPFLKDDVEPGQQFWVFLYPGTIRSLRHEWSHDEFPQVAGQHRTASEEWMRAWAVMHTPGNYYDDAPCDPDAAYQFAIEAGETMHVGPYECARDDIDNTWWDHWEAITGKVAGDKRGGYFSCSC